MQRAKGTGPRRRKVWNCGFVNQHLRGLEVLSFDPGTLRVHIPVHIGGWRVEKRLEAPPGFEPGVEVLQTSALPLGDGALLKVVREADGWTVNEPGWLGSTAFDEARTGSKKLHFAAAVPWTSTRAERSRPNKPA